MDGWMGGCVCVWVDRWLDEWMDGWMDGRMDGWVDETAAPRGGSELGLVLGER